MSEKRPRPWGEQHNEWLAAVRLALRRLGDLGGLMAPELALLRDSALVQHRLDLEQTKRGEGWAALCLRRLLVETMGHMAAEEGEPGREGRLLLDRYVYGVPQQELALTNDRCLRTIQRWLERAEQSLALLLCSWECELRQKEENDDSLAR